MDKTKRKIKPFQKLDLKDRFLFEQVADDPKCCKAILEIVFGRDIAVLTKNETEKEFRTTSEKRSVRLDVFAADDEEKVYNLEFQQRNVGNLPKRGRYYQAHLDVTLLEPGEIDFGKLNDSYLIMITCFDLFRAGKYRYTCRMVCEEVPGAVLPDGACRIFLNTRGTDSDDVSQELIDFLHYAEESSEHNCRKSHSSRLNLIHEQVCKIKQNEEMGVRYMQDWEERILIKEEGREEGREEGIRQKAIAVAKELLDILEVDVIAKKVGISVEEVEKLKKESREDL